MRTKKFGFTLAEGATHVGLLPTNAKAGFTLAEVLITLGIIGVVAAVTMPSLISNIQDRQHRAKWKTVYSQINNAFNKVYFENQDTYGNGVEGTGWWNTQFVGQMMSQFEVLDKCGTPPKSLLLDMPQCNFRQKHKWNALSNNHSIYKTLAGGSLNAYDFMDFSYLLKNGASIYFGGSHSGPTILVDVNNASAGPNVLGRDVFGIHCGPNTACTKLVPMGAVDTYHPNTVYNYNGKVVGACSKDIGTVDTNYIYTASGAGCAAKYLME